jgi:hypothetical protein
MTLPITMTMTHTTKEQIMPGLVVNAQEAMESRKPLPEGEYHVVLTQSTLKDASGPDKYPMIVLEFTVHEDEGEPYAGKKAFRNLSASPKAIPFMVDAAIALGADSDEVLGTAVDFEQVFKDVEGCECWIKTAIRSWQRNENEPAVEQTDVKNIQAQPSA